MSAQYLFGPLERRGVFLGARGGQIVVGVATTTAAIAALTAATTALGAMLAVAVVALGGAVALLPIAGRTAEQWIPVVAAFVVQRMSGGWRWTATAPHRGHRLVLGAAWTGHEVIEPPSSESRRPRLRVVPAPSVPPHGNDSNSDGTVTGRDAVGEVRALDAGESQPPWLRGIELLAVRWSAGEVGVLADRRAHTYVAVLGLGAPSPALQDEDGRAQQLQRWGAVLAGIGRDGSSAITRLQWVETAAPNDTEAAVRHLDGHRVHELSNPFVRSYLELLDGQATQTQRHEVVLAVQVSAARASSTIRHLRRGEELGACTALSAEVTALARTLRQADIEVRGVLSPRMLAARLRCAVDPGAHELLAIRGRLDADRAGASARGMGPLSSAVSWTSLRTDGAVHATYWVAEWPRLPVGTDWLSPLVLGTGCRRTFAVVMEPSSPQRALRRVEAARVDDETTASLRQRFGFRQTVRRRRESENAARAEEELNEGHQHLGFSAHLTVTASTEAELATACTDVEQQAALARLDLRREYGTQDAAFSYTLPLCRGLR